MIKEGEHMEQIQGIDKRFQVQLQKSFPNGEVSEPSKNVPSLYHELQKYCSEKNISVVDYIKSLGFTYVKKSKRPPLEKLIEKIKKIFPDMIIDGISELQKKDVTLYRHLREELESRKLNITPTDLLKQQGFEIIQKNTSSHLYDLDALIKLKTDYNCNFSDLAKIFGVTKQNLDQKIKRRKNNNYPTYWQEKTFSEEQIQLLQIITKEHTYSYDDEVNHVRIYKHEKTREFALFIKDNQDIICSFELPEEIKALLISEKYDQYDAIDFEIMEEIQNSDLITVNAIGIEELRFVRTDSPILYDKIYSRLRLLPFSREEYLKHLGFNLVNSLALPTDEIIKQLSVYADDSNVVHIPCSDPNHARFANMAHKKGFPSIKSFLNHYGFEYRRTRTLMESIYADNAIEEIKKHYIVSDNKVYINSADPFYVSLYWYAKKRGKFLIDLLAEWGFERLYKEDLPKDYKPYAWIEKRYVLEDEEDYKKILDDFILEDNLIYLDSSTYFYSKLYRVALIHGMTINELLEEWGYKRIYFYEENEISQQQIIIDSDNETDYINQIIENLKGIQGDLSTSTTEQQKRNRSQKLATEIKKLYAYQCQLCSHSHEEGIWIPPIEKEDGTFYVEAHHIIPVSANDLVSDDAVDVIIDSYENVVVVCPYHHRVLHFHKGGFSKIVEKDGVLYFISKHDDLLKIHTNYHLKATESAFV